jgi:hypothetical protein
MGHQAGNERVIAIADNGGNGRLLECSSSHFFAGRGVTAIARDGCESKQPQRFRHAVANGSSIPGRIGPNRHHGFPSRVHGAGTKSIRPTAGATGVRGSKCADCGHASDAHGSQTLI